MQIIALVLIINNHSFHKSKFINSTNSITGTIYSKTNAISEYLKLKSQNEILSEENKKLKNKLAKYQLISNDSVRNIVVKDSIFNQQYEYINGKILKNEFHKSYNFLTINRGENHGVQTELAVVNSKGIIGITDDASSSYARVQSILNRNSKINARFIKNNFFGSVTWNTKDYNVVQLTDIPRQAVYKVGDTIITGGKSTIFPEGILIGTVMDIPTKASALNTINIKLFNDMSNLGYVYIIKNLDKKEIENLEKTPDE
ncbi:rod shape-determining protein MreC [Tenacibaculum adriaticum]|uniref:rod shape-determining protein MreC n=1 Tax=Tenacibaculum adriaticum TaxID=413713 RepID=UPI0029393F2F|nr:rod shape-determining protein MreC [Tenacibaculum adriaticum]